MITDYLKDKRIMFLLLILIALAALDLTVGVHLGIEFIGGTQIPVTLEQPVNPDTMTNIISILQQRISTFGIKEITIEGVGDSALYVIVPTVSNSEINSTISLIESQGVFEGIVNGQEALNGSSILSGSIGSVPATVTTSGVTWAVNFFLTQKAAAYFSRVVFGQANKPLYMFLDRPSKAIILLNQSVVAALSANSSESTVMSALQNALTFGSQTIPLQIISNNTASLHSLMSYLAQHNSTYDKVILSKATPQYIINNITKLGYSVVPESALNITPVLFYSGSLSSKNATVDSWAGVGLLSAPLLSPNITNGLVTESYEISGMAPTSLPIAKQEAFANNQSKMIASILNGGTLPVHVLVGAPLTYPATLGKQFLYESGIAGIFAIVAVMVIILIKYRRPFLVVPIMLTTFAELFIIFSIIGVVGTIDLAAVAGMIAVVGTGVDAQIIITDEVLVSTARESAIKLKLGNAFYIVWADAILLAVAMLPLFFSTSLVQIIGFSESTILGALLGVLITRPAYGAIIRIKYGKSE